VHVVLHILVYCAKRLRKKDTLSVLRTNRKPKIECTSNAALQPLQNGGFT